MNSAVAFEKIQRVLKRNQLVIFKPRAMLA